MSLTYVCLFVFCSVGCDSKAIIALLCSRTNSQRQRIELEYKTMHGRVRLKISGTSCSKSWITISLIKCSPINVFYPLDTDLFAG